MFSAEKTNCVRNICCQNWQKTIFLRKIMHADRTLRRCFFKHIRKGSVDMLSQTPSEALLYLCSCFVVNPSFLHHIIQIMWHLFLRKSVCLPPFRHVHGLLFRSFWRKFSSCLYCCDRAAPPAERYLASPRKMSARKACVNCAETPCSPQLLFFWQALHLLAHESKKTAVKHFAVCFF